MGFINKFIGSLSKKNQIKYTKTTKTLTKHGMFKVKIYEHNQQEYLVIMSQNFSSVDNPIFYIHSDEHECDALDQFCDCSYPISVALKMIHKDGGFILYSSYDAQDIDRLLQEINAKKLQADNKVMIGTNIRSALKGYKGEYLTIDFILKDLGLSKVQLVSDNPNIIFIVQQRGINIDKQAPSISFTYGDTYPQKSNEILDAINAIEFKYPQNQ